MTRKSECEEVGLETNNKATMEDLHLHRAKYRLVYGCRHIVNQESRGQHAELELGASTTLSFGQRRMMKLEDAQVASS